MFRCKKHGIEFRGHFKNGNVPKCPKCFPNRRSSAEIELCEALRNSGIFIETNVNGVIENRELDIYIPSIKTGIEFNGVYWHSKKSKKYHLNKTLACEKKGIRLIHVFEDEWLRDKQLAIRRIMYEIGIFQNEKFAHEYYVLKEEGRFNLSRGNEVPISLMFNGESIEFSYGDYLTRVIGGEERLLREYVRCIQPTKIIYRADRSRNGGEHLKQFGFVLLERTSPNYFYINCRTLERIYPESNYVGCSEKDYFKLWDCGQNVYEWKRED